MSAEWSSRAFSRRDAGFARRPRVDNKGSSFITNISGCLTQLDALLSTDVASLVSRQESQFRKAIAPTGESHVLFGAGRLGRIALAGLRRAGVQPIAFADNDPVLWNTSVDDLPVLSPDDAASRFRAQAVFVVTVYTGNPVRLQLEALNLRVASFASLAWHHPTAMLPHGAVELPRTIYDQAADVRKGLSLWSDDASRLEYLAQLQWRTSLDASVLPPHLPKEQTYYLDDLVALSPHETFVDCGAFDGDSVRDFLARQGMAFNHIVAIEPDPATYQRLVAYTNGLAPDVRNRVTTIPKAAGTRAGMVRFDATGTAASALGQGSLEVESLPLDVMLEGITPTYIKVDVEGAEPDVLRGARDVIKRHRPVLAVCLYHKQEHLWQIPLLLGSLATDYRLFLRRYSDDCWELVGYAVPEERVKKGLAGSGGKA